MGQAGLEYVFCLKCSHCCVYFSVLELLQPVTPGNPLNQPHWPPSVACGLPQPEDQMTLVWPSPFQRRYAISSTHLNDQRHIWIHLYLTDLICNDKSFQILGFTVHPYMFCYLYSKHTAMFGEIWLAIMAIMQIVPNYSTAYKTDNSDMLPKLI